MCADSAKRFPCLDTYTAMNSSTTFQFRVASTRTIQMGSTFARHNIEIECTSHVILISLYEQGVTAGESPQIRAVF